VNGSPSYSVLPEAALVPRDHAVPVSQGGDLVDEHLVVHQESVGEDDRRPSPPVSSNQMR
jgi:hypothetical protein